MKSGRYSVREILADGDIGVLCVPEIQRDYVWGKDNVEPFLRDIIAGASRNHAPEMEDVIQKLPERQRSAYRLFSDMVLNRQNVGFLYAYYDPDVPERYFLIDGQQRFTTIYLTMAILAAKDARLRQRFVSRYFTPSKGLPETDYRSYSPKVDYRVREVAHVFLQHFIFDLVVGIGRKEVAEYMSGILSPGEGENEPESLFPWWQLRFETDRTICSILRNARYISSVLSEVGKNRPPQFLEDLFTYMEDSIEFWYFDTNLSAQGEELYIYMNSRGEQLSYNENRRAACIACFEESNKPEKSRSWDDCLQNQYFIRRGDEPSADKGLDLFLHVVEMFHWSFSSTATLNNEAISNEWQFFFQGGTCHEVPASKQLLKDYFDYQLAVEFLWKSKLDVEISTAFTKMFDTFLLLQQGKWIDGNTITQNDVLQVLACLELFKGIEEPVAEMRQKVLCSLYFIANLVRHENVRRNPASWVLRLLSLAKVLREKCYDVTKLLDNDNELLRDNDEKWRLKLLARLPHENREELILQMLGLFDELARDDQNVLCGDIYLLFAVAFRGKPDEVLSQAEIVTFDELAAKLRYAHAACAIHFGKQADIWFSAYRMMKDFGDYTICHDGERWRYPYDLCRHIYNWHGIMTYDKDVPKDVWPRANPVVVRYLRSSFLPLEKQERKEVLSSPMNLISKIARTDVGQKLFKSIWDYTEGRFKTMVKVGQNGENLYQIIFKGKISLFRLISGQYLDNVKDDSYIVIGNDRKKFDVWLKERSSPDAPIAACIETDTQNLECELSELDEVVACFVQSGGRLAEAGRRTDGEKGIIMCGA